MIKYSYVQVMYGLFTQYKIDNKYCILQSLWMEFYLV